MVFLINQVELEGSEGSTPYCSGNSSCESTNDVSLSSFWILTIRSVVFDSN
jgi:hypothetical protein